MIYTCKSANIINTFISKLNKIFNDLESNSPEYDFISYFKNGEQDALLVRLLCIKSVEEDCSPKKLK